MATQPKEQRIAFALGGLGGSNGHCVGFLEAARRRAILPAVISCTSGAIYWVYKYLAGEPLGEEILERSDSALFPPWASWLNWTTAMTTGVAGVCRPAVTEAVWRWARPWNVWDAKAWADRALPAQLMVRTIREADFAAMARAFNEEERVGVAFNVFEPRLATEYVHVNEAARRFIGKELERRYDSGVMYRPITAEAVADALWLYLYGFEGRERVDGAYHRQIILRELSAANVIYAVRPQNQRWIGELPSNQLMMRDMEIELWFNSSYAGEVAGIELINSLLDKGRLRDDAGYHPIEVIPIEIGLNRGFFDYFVEDPAVYQAALKHSLAAFELSRPPAGKDERAAAPRPALLEASAPAA